METKCEVCEEICTCSRENKLSQNIIRAQCGVCGEIVEFRDIEIFKQHLMTHGPLKVDRPYKCEYCQEAFALKTWLAAHWKSVHPEERPYPCDTCEKSFKDNLTVKKHRRNVHKGERPYDDVIPTLKCEVCSRVFFKEVVFNEHIQTHSSIGGKVTHACGFCDETFELKNKLEAHWKSVHPEERPYPCDMCDSSFRRRSAATKHMRNIHKEEKKLLSQPTNDNITPTHKCEVCGKVLQDKNVLKQHMKIHGNLDIASLGHECGYCDKVFFFKKLLATHWKNIHPEERPYQCNTCSNSYKDRHSLKAHRRRVHKGVKPKNQPSKFLVKFKCKKKECGKVFNNFVVYNQHLQTHGPLKENECYFCGEVFDTRLLLTTHWRTVHPEERPYSCDICDKSYKDPNTLLSHTQYTHTDVRPFKCRLCESRFMRKYCLTAHVKSVHAGIKPFACDRCDKRFHRPWALKKHKQLVHTDENPDAKLCFSNDTMMTETNCLSSHQTHESQVCGESLVSSEYLSNHMKAQHRSKKGTRVGEPAAEVPEAVPEEIFDVPDDLYSEIIVKNEPIEYEEEFVFVNVVFED